MTARQIFIFRHGETDWNRDGRFQGQMDVPLNDHGRGQARDLIPRLLDHGIEAILSSDLSRARETGQIVATALGLPHFEHIGLREAHLGHAQGLTREQIEALFGEELVTQWKSIQATDADVSYPGGETGIQVMERAFRALEEFLAQNTFSRIGVATHGGVIRRIMQKLLPPGSEPVPIPNGVLYGLIYLPGRNEWTLNSDFLKF